ncbi:hypothetical protein, unlikely [Trypanosoma brucei gambiense DAL972]|uniref:Uncharacterized protein n=1 Tax=Trypanosoma brucei gambiense (strain MHOM/CI/86/DAL972) TaxID=679716 RepID=D0A058_TRYB9|nr:hypothetical protein, unlikely [Trypanosoma brucei gambiense DAL972]CBH16616.1 hypothetical protein, unlikely [Trypanosoma brucei gambiense DAL972]|eukprot:XP_011778880.1 hypothetical protein, unlikely [Trypanosoma brucei gambiense DAL972]
MENECFFFFFYVIYRHVNNLRSDQRRLHLLGAAFVSTRATGGGGGGVALHLYCRSGPSASGPVFFLLIFFFKAGGLRNLLPTRTTFVARSFWSSKRNVSCFST